MKRIPFLAALALTVGANPADCRGAGAADPPLLPARFEPAKPPMPTRDSTGLKYQGTVTEVMKDSITVQWPGEKPKKFAASEVLASGGYSTKNHARLDGRPEHTVSPSFRYRLSDVKAGDIVDLHFSHLGGLDICDNIRIIKRPGGRVPPLPEGAENLMTPAGIPRIPYHEGKNAYWALEDKGIPFPEKFGANRRFPLAPMPRAIGLDGPLISP